MTELSIQDQVCRLAEWHDLSYQGMSALDASGYNNRFWTSEAVESQSLRLWQCQGSVISVELQGIVGAQVFLLRLMVQEISPTPEEFSEALASAVTSVWTVAPRCSLASAPASRIHYP